MGSTSQPVGRSWDNLCPVPGTEPGMASKGVDNSTDCISNSDDEHASRGNGRMTRRDRTLFSHTWGTSGTGDSTLWPQPPLTLAQAGAQHQLPMAARVPTRMPTADTLVGMPFMRPTLRMHCPSVLQRHTTTVEGESRAQMTGKGTLAADTRGVCASA